jgi:hypothetical protein
VARPAQPGEWTLTSSPVGCAAPWGPYLSRWAQHDTEKPRGHWTGTSLCRRSRGDGVGVDQRREADWGLAGQAPAAMLAVRYLCAVLPILIVLGRAASALGSVSVRTPCSNCAVARSASTGPGKVIERA